MKTIVVTGASATSGSQVVRELAGRGVQVIAVDRSAALRRDRAPGVRWWPPICSTRRLICAKAHRVRARRVPAPGMAQRVRPQR